MYVRETPLPAPEKETPVMNPDDTYSIKSKFKPAPYKGQMFQDIPRKFQDKPNRSNISQDISRYPKMFHYIPISSNIFQDIPRRSNIIQDIPRYSDMFQYTPRYSDMFQ